MMLEEPIVRTEKELIQLVGSRRNTVSGTLKSRDAFEVMVQIWDCRQAIDDIRIAWKNYTNLNISNIEDHCIYQNPMRGKDLYLIELEDVFQHQEMFRRHKTAESTPILEAFSKIVDDFKYMKVAESRLKQKARRVIEPKDTIKRIHDSGLSLEDWQKSVTIDWLLGIDEQNVERYLQRRGYRETEQLANQGGSFYSPSSYHIIREFIQQARPASQDVVYDMGSGHGKVCFYGALTTEAMFKGIELMPQRVDACNQVKARWNIKNIEFIQGNVLEKDYSDGTIFFFFNPFSEWGVGEEVFGKLKEMARHKHLKIGVYFDVDDLQNNLDWLTQTYEKNSRFWVYMSK